MSGSSSQVRAPHRSVVTTPSPPSTHLPASFLPRSSRISQPLARPSRHRRALLRLPVLGVRPRRHSTCARDRVLSRQVLGARDPHLDLRVGILRRVGVRGRELDVRSRDGRRRSHRGDWWDDSNAVKDSRSEGTRLRPSRRRPPLPDAVFPGVGTSDVSFPFSSRRPPTADSPSSRAQGSVPTIRDIPIEEVNRVLFRTPGGDRRVRRRGDAG